MGQSIIINTIPQAQLILGYKECFNEESPEDRLSIVSGICKRHLIAELAGLNYRLKPKNTKHQDTSLTTQLKELRYFCNNDDNTINKDSKITNRYTNSKNNFPRYFSRQSCTLGLEEIIQSD